MNSDRQADVIKIAAVLTAAPRWAGALMAADGVPIPDTWELWWRWLALGSSMGMAIVEGFAIAFVFRAWRNQQDKRASNLLWLATAMLVAFGMVLTPYIMSNVSGVALAQVLDPWPLLLAWGLAIAASTGLVVGSVGYAQRDKPAKAKQVSSSSKQDSKEIASLTSYACDICGATENKSGEPFASWQAVAGHKRWEHSNDNGHEPEPKPVKVDEAG